MACINAMAASTSQLREIAEWRGYSREFCAWLVANKLLGLFKGKIAFPVYQNGIVVCPHWLQDRPNKVWKFFTGMPASPLLLGDLETATDVHLHESTWDGLAFHERTEAYKCKEVCTIITRGADHTAKLRGLIPAGKRIYAWPQNDQPNEKSGKIPSETWLNGVRAVLGVLFFHVQTPKEFADLNDWTRSGATKNQLLDAIDAASPIEPQECEIGPAARPIESEVVPEPPRIYLEFLKPSEIKAYQPPKGHLLAGDNHIVRGSVFVLAGPPGVGKSRGLVALAEAGAYGFDWFGLSVHTKFKTLIIQNENGRFRLKQEFAELDDTILDQYVRVTPPPPYGLCFGNSEFRDQLKAYRDDFQPELVAIDPWNAVARDDKAKDYLESFDLIRSVFPASDDGPAIGIAPHTRKPQQGDRANGRALLNLLAGSYVLTSVPRSVWVLQHASDDVSETRVVVTCCKNSDGELGNRCVCTRSNGQWSHITDFDWDAWDHP
ncbi:MAG: AAA family ATPase, partial [Verrucomicrobia bacterium]|nr:AAA family ATPase [Verrucomicrobiota bacterium]